MDIFSKYAWIVPLKDKKGVSIVNAFQKILKESNRKPNQHEFRLEKIIKKNGGEVMIVHSIAGLIKKK